MNSFKQRSNECRVSRLVGIQSRRAQIVLGAELFFLAGLLGFYAFVGILDGAIDARLANIFGSTALGATLLWSTLSQLRIEPHSIWGALIWFRIACAVYYALGAVIPYVGTASTVLSMKTLYPFSDDELLKVNAIVAVAVFLVLLASRLVPSSITAASASDGKTPAGQLVIAAGAFLFIGGVARYGSIVPALTESSSGLLIGSIAAVAKTYSAGLMLLLLYGLHNHRYVLGVAVALIAIELFVGLLLFNKTDLIITILFVVLAVYQARPSRLRLAVGGVIAVTVFTQVAPLVEYGRDRVLHLNGGLAVASLEQRFDIVREYIKQPRRELFATDDFQPALNRISYANAMTMVVAWYDQGRPGWTFQNAMTVIVPRVLWSDKPNMTISGHALYSEATGQIGTSISAGLFAEAYWNFGWFGLPFLLLPFGIILGIISKIGVEMIKRGRWLYLPVALLGIQIGTRVDGHYVTDVIGASAILFVAYVVSRLIEPLMFFSRDRSFP